MTSNESGTASDQEAVRQSESKLLLEAVEVLRRRYQEGGRYAELPPFAATELGDLLAGIAARAEIPDGVDRDEVLALAHRLIDDDHPELSPMWPSSTG